jgi:hypothetical protein
MNASLDKEFGLIQMAISNAFSRLVHCRRIFAIVETPCYGLKRRDYPVRSRHTGPVIGSAVLETDSTHAARWCIEFLRTVDADIVLDALLVTGPAPGTVTADVHGDELCGFIVTPGGTCCNQQTEA